MIRLNLRELLIADCLERGNVWSSLTLQSWSVILTAEFASRGGNAEELTRVGITVYPASSMTKWRSGETARKVHTLQACGSQMVGYSRAVRSEQTVAIAGKKGGHFAQGSIEGLRAPGLPTRY